MGDPDPRGREHRHSSGIRDLDPAVLVEKRRARAREGARLGFWSAAALAAAMSLAEAPGLLLDERAWDDFVAGLDEAIEGALVQSSPAP